MKKTKQFRFMTYVKYAPGSYQTNSEKNVQEPRMILGE